MERKIITFWCHRCRIDWKLIARRRWRNSLFGWVWSAKCDECNREMVRLIDDAVHDPYFRLSKKVKGERKKYEFDLIQMGDPRFDMLYPQHKKEREQREFEEAKKAYDSRLKNT